MPLSNAEKQARFRARRDDKLRRLEELERRNVFFGRTTKADRVAFARFVLESLDLKPTDLSPGAYRRETPDTPGPPVRGRKGGKVS
jgi:hypothetical protein